MNIEKNTLVGKWYSLSYILTQKLFGNDTWEYDEMVGIPRSTNLCTMMRSMFIWTPLYIFFAMLLLSGYGYAFFYLPFTYGGAIGYFNVYIVPVIIIGMVVAGVMGYMYLSKIWESEISKEEKRKLKEARHAAGNYTVMELVVKWIKARHRKICPLIDIVQKGEDK